jgi:flagellar hook-associated protein 2
LSGSGAANVLGGSPAPVNGTDVAGTINESAGVGSGQFLTGAKGNAAEGLKLLINNGSTGDRGTVKFSSGYATYMSTMLDDFLSDKGIVNSSIKDIGHQRDVLNQRLVGVEARYRAMFTRLDTTLAKLTADGNFLTQQLQQLSNLSKG